MPAVDASRRMPAADAPFTYPHTLTCHPTGTPKAPVHPAAAGDRPCCSSNKRSLTASPRASAAGRGQPGNGVLSGEDRRARVLLARADATENERAGCAPIWASSPTCVPQRQPKNSASRVARCPPRAPLDQQSSNGVAIAPGGRALCAAASARYLAGAARPSSSIRTTRGGSITPSTAPVMLRKCCIFFSGKNESSGPDSGRFVSRRELASGGEPHQLACAGAWLCAR